MPEGLNLLSEGFGLTKEQRRLIIRVLWVAIVSTHILWVCGLLGFLGLSPPFAWAADVDSLRQATLVSARLNLVTEIRTQTRAWCSITDPTTREAIATTIDKLREEYRRVAGGASPPEQRCPS
jgi:hypothetical protein